MKNIQDTRRILIGWGTGKDGSIRFWVSHKDLPETLRDPIGCDPLEVAKVLVGCVKKINKIRKK